MQPKFLAFAGSTRSASLNKLLAACAAQAARRQGVEVTQIDLRDYPLPLYDGDLESASGMPDNALAIRRTMADHHGVILSCPEYNSAITAVLKNTIDWISRPVPNEPALAAFASKTAALFAATPGTLAGIRTLASVRSILSSLGMIVIPEQFGLGSAASAFDQHGEPIDEQVKTRIDDVIAQLIQVTSGLEP